jgi:integrase
LNTRISGHVRKRGGAWEVVLELGRQPAQRCPACMERKGRNGGRLLWIDGDRHEACPTCGGEVEEVVARRQVVLTERHRTKREAQERLVKELHAANEGGFLQPSGVALGDYLRKEWLPSLEAQDLSPNTVTVYTTQVEQRIAPKIGDVPLQRLTARHVTALAVHLATKDGPRGHTLSPATRRQALSVLSMALNAAVRAGYLRANPAIGVKRPKVSAKEMSSWSAEELAKFLTSTRHDRLYPLWRFLSHTGFRKGEALGLRWEDLDLVAGTVTLRRQRTKAGSFKVCERRLKAGNPRTIDLDPGTVAALRSWKAKQNRERLEWGKAWTATGHVFTREDGQPWHPDLVYDKFVKACTAAEVPQIRVHDLRHTVASLAIPAGVPLKVIQERFGHSSRTMTDLYSHLEPGMQREASERLAALVDGALEGKK